MNLASLKICRGTMPATLTYRSRWWHWLSTPGLPCDGVLTLGQVHDRTLQVDEQTYGVEEVRSAHLGFRGFCIRKLGAALGAEDEQYTVSIGPRVSVCSCKAGKTRSEVCRHRDGLAAVIAAGALPAKSLVGA